jgi:hypothetical protein
MAPDRVEIKLERLQETVQALAVAVAELAVELKTNSAISSQFSAHEKEDAAVHAKLQSEIHRLWWLAGGIGSAAMGALVKAFQVVHP